MSAADKTLPTSRDRLSNILLILLEAIGVALTILVALPLLPALTLALSLAVVAHPLHRWIARRVRYPDIAAALAVLSVTLVIVVPAILIANQVVQQAQEGYNSIQQQVQSGELQRQLDEHPQVAEAVAWVQSHIGVDSLFSDAGNLLKQRVGGWVSGTVLAILQVLVALFVLFYLFRDRAKAVQWLRNLLPLSNSESGEVLEKLRGMVHATVYGTFVVAAIQGALGGLMFWILGIPGALLWGTVMALLSLVPNLGAFVVWLPAAVLMIAQGEWTKAVILAVWGAVAVGSIDNLLYPILVGNEMRMHTVPVFIATVGGLFVFGAAGLVLGPVIFAATFALLQVIRRRPSPPPEA